MPAQKPGYYWECNECGDSFSGHCDQEELVDHYDCEHPHSPKILYMGDISDIFTKRMSHAIKARSKSKNCKSH